LIRAFRAIVAVLALGLAMTRARAQENPNLPPGELGCTPGVALQVRLAITRLKTEEKEAGLPYTFLVAARPSPACPAKWVRMRMVVDTPVPVVTIDESDAKKPKSTVVGYRHVGTSLDCSAEDLGDGRFKLFLIVESRSTLPGGEPGPNDDLSGFPVSWRFETSLQPILRDGQRAEAVLLSDSVTGEVVKIALAVNVVKR
jgi:hypothetical protein